MQILQNVKFPIGEKKFYDAASHFNGEEIVGTFYEKELRKKNHKELT